MRLFPWPVVVLAFWFVVALPLLGKWARHTGLSQCAWDGGAVTPLYRVRIVDDRGIEHEFCCVRCATAWLNAQRGKPNEILVTDEVSGRELSAGDAWFVRSSVAADPAIGSRIHVFRERTDAEHHAAAALGKLLRGMEEPFADAR
jgi:hypothetical protein